MPICMMKSEKVIPSQIGSQISLGCDSSCTLRHQKSFFPMESNMCGFGVTAGQFIFGYTLTKEQCVARKQVKQVDLCIITIRPDTKDISSDYTCWGKWAKSNFMDVCAYRINETYKQIQMENICLWDSKCTYEIGINIISSQGFSYSSETIITDV